VLEALDFGTGLSGHFRIVDVDEFSRLGKFVVGLREPIGKGDDLEESLVFATQGGEEFPVAERFGVAQLPLDGGGTVDRRRETCSDAQVVFFPPTAYF
jgi:hypothetical protein